MPRQGAEVKKRTLTYLGPQGIWRGDRVLSTCHRACDDAVRSRQAIRISTGRHHMAALRLGCLILLELSRQLYRAEVGKTISSLCIP